MATAPEYQLYQGETFDAVRSADGSLWLSSTLPFDVPSGCVHDVIERWARLRPDHPVLKERTSDDAEWTILTYAHLWADAGILARSLCEMGLGQHRPLLILAPNSISHLKIAVAAMRSGIPYAPVTPAYLLSEGGRAKLAAVLEALNPGAVFLPDADRAALAGETALFDGCTKILGEAPAEIKDAVSLDQLIERGGDSMQELPLVDPSAIAKLVFTSGSTGTPKGVVTTHRMLLSDVEMVRAAWPVLKQIDPVAIDWLPWSHVFGGSLGLGLVLCGGGTLHIDNGKPTAGGHAISLRNIRQVQPNMFWNVPKAYEMLRDAMLSDASLRDAFFKNLRFMFYGAASIAKAVGDDLEQMATASVGRPVPLMPAWGLTETTCVASAAREPLDIEGYIGTPLPGCTVKLAPVSGKMEIRVKGSNVTPGYWKLPDVNASVFDEDGFFRTGDAVRLLDGANPARGLIFDGRISEDFKLSTGTWVDVTGLQKRMRSALAGLVTDVVVAAPDRDYLGLLVFPARDQNAGSDAYRKALRERIAMENGEVSASSRTIVAAIIADEPASAIDGEVTEKGSINSRLVLSRRKGLIDKLYNPQDPDVVRL